MFRRSISDRRTRRGARAQVTPAAPIAPAPSGVLRLHPSLEAARLDTLQKEPVMDETARRRARHAAARRGAHDAERRNAAAALQRALDRRDNGGSTGH
jgi:hypothetical protein